MKLATALAAFLVALASPALALPPLGATRPEVRLVDAWDRPLAVTRAATKPILVVYEDKDSKAQNQPLKDELARLPEKNGFVVLPIADVAGYDYWPARGFVKDAIQSESHRVGQLIYCDWDLSAQRAFAFRRGTSSVVLYSRAGKVLLAHEGPMLPARRAELVALLRAQVGGS